MNQLPADGRQVDILAALELIGFSVSRRNKGHLVLGDDTGRMLTLPDHSRIKEYTLAGALKQAGISKTEFMDAYRQL